MHRAIQSSNVSASVPSPNLNQFGYANSEVVASYKYKNKNVRQSDQSERNPYIESEAVKTKYNAIRKQQQQDQRRKAKEQQSKKREQERKQKQLKLQQQLMKKKQELQELQNLKKHALEQEKRAQELAVIKIEQDEIQKIENQEKHKQNKYNANVRFVEALRRLDDQSKDRDFKKTQANYRRKVYEDVQKAERGKAIQYKAELEEKQRQRQLNAPKSVQFVDYKQTLGRNAYGINHMNKDFSKSYSHNPKIIVVRKHLQEEADPDNNAIQRAKVEEEVRRSSSARKRLGEEDQRKKSLERGQKALIKVQRQKQYDEYCREAEQKAIEYNLERVQEGKRNQYIGVRPTTLQQMRTNKNQRSQQEFQKVFISRNNPEWISSGNRQANKYEIVQHRNLQLNSQGEEEEIIIKRHNVPVERDHFYRNSKDSINPGVSNGNYSFEGSSELEGLTSVKKQQEDLERECINEEDNEDQDDQPRTIPQPTHVQPMKNKGLTQTNFQNTRKTKKEGLGQTNFHDVRKTKKEGRQPVRNQEKDEFADSLDATRGYRMQRKEPQRRVVYEQVDSPSKQKLSNVCQNRREGDLDYSESQDSDI